MARPKADIDKKEVEKLASYGCTNTEIADFFGVTEGTIRKGYSEIITKGKSELKQRLRKAQIEHALKGNATLLIWLGKQILGQTDNQDTENKDTQNINITIQRDTD
mgnify:CR=1 FL=1